MRTLNQNRNLLWFAVLAGLVLAGNTIGQSSRYFISWNMHMQLGIMYDVLEFLIEFATIFCLVFLLAGLFLSIPREEGVSSSLFAGIAGAKKIPEGDLHMVLSPVTCRNISRQGLKFPVTAWVAAGALEIQSLWVF
ncbi:hypothetical protein [Methanolacinia petrolearia]|uniref:hypothetical protein n=1 Tax=Methanolacinia petrolearia TaxID=54120 RepID=UPI003BAA773E